MSNERQEYSPDNQAAAIETYAADHGMAIVRTYCDEVRNGVRLVYVAELSRLAAAAIHSHVLELFMGEQQGSNVLRRRWVC
jgi:DNA invertase Pin-like site-specific DNA recombinase